MELLEREAQLAQMDVLREEAAARHGHLLLIGGEAGVGKTALIHRFCNSADPRSRVILGACDALSTPRPHSPLLDVSADLTPEVQRLLETEGSRHRLFGAVLDALADNARGTLFVVEDAHWADEATLDLIRYLSRRIQNAPILLIVTYRDDEVGSRHPLRVALGDIASSSVIQRMKLPALSKDAVETLAVGSAMDVSVLYHQTGGNPIYITEVLAAQEPGPPSSVRDAVLARASRLSTGARELLDAAAVIGGIIAIELLGAVAGSDHKA